MGKTRKKRSGSECDLCDRIFPTRQGLLMHKRMVHRPKKPNLCSNWSSKKRNTIKKKLGESAAFEKASSAMPVKSVNTLEKTTVKKVNVTVPMEIMNQQVELIVNDDKDNCARNGPVITLRRITGPDVKFSQVYFTKSAEINDITMENPIICKNKVNCRLGQKRQSRRKRNQGKKSSKQLSTVNPVSFESGSLNGKCLKPEKFINPSFKTVSCITITTNEEEVDNKFRRGKENLTQSFDESRENGEDAEYIKEEFEIDTNAEPEPILVTTAENEKLIEGRQVCNIAQHKIQSLENSTTSLLQENLNFSTATLLTSAFPPVSATVSVSQKYSEDKTKTKNESLSLSPHDDANFEGMPSLDLYTTDCKSSDNSSSNYGSPPRLTLCASFSVPSLSPLSDQESHKNVKPTQLVNLQELDNSDVPPTGSKVNTSISNTVDDDKPHLSTCTKSNTGDAINNQSFSTASIPSPRFANCFAENLYFMRPLIIHRPPGHPCPNKTNHWETKVSSPHPENLVYTFKGETMPFPSQKLLRELGTMNRAQSNHNLFDREKIAEDVGYNSVSLSQLSSSPSRKTSSPTAEKANQKSECSKCGKVYSNYHNLKRHIRNTHNNEDKSNE